MSTASFAQAPYLPAVPSSGADVPPASGERHVPSSRRIDTRTWFVEGDILAHVSPDAPVRRSRLLRAWLERQMDAERRRAEYYRAARPRRIAVRLVGLALLSALTYGVVDLALDRAEARHALSAWATMGFLER